MGGDNDKVHIIVGGVFSQALVNMTVQHFCMLFYSIKLEPTGYLVKVFSGFSLRFSIYYLSLLVSEMGGTTL